VAIANGAKSIAMGFSGDDLNGSFLVKIVKSVLLTIYLLKRGITSLTSRPTG